MFDWNSAVEKIEQVEDEAIEFYKNLHAHPELSSQEVETSSLIAKKLTDLGYQVTDKIGTTGVVGILKNGTGPTVLFRADMDALPVKEATDLPYAAKNVTAVDEDGHTTPVMHACGHDVHMTSLVYAAEFFANNKADWQGTFIALFQPAEETAEGAEAMVKADLSKLIPKPTVALAQHVMALPAGKVYVKKGVALSTALNARISVYGRGAHGSMPEKSIDPAIIIASIVTRLQTIVSRELSPQDFGVVTVGKIKVGTKANVIADTGELELNIRAFNEEVKTKIVAAIKRIVEGECSAAGCEKSPSIEYFNAFPLTINDEQVFQKVTSQLATIFGEDYQEIDEVAPASEDFSEIPNALQVPYLYMFIGGADPKVYEKAAKEHKLDSLPANHSPFYAPTLSPTLVMGIKNIVASTLAYLG